MTHVDRLRGNLDHMESEWENLQDGIPQANYNRIKIIVEESMSAAEASLRRAELFVCHAVQQSTSTERRTKAKSEDARSSGKLDRLENTLRLTIQLIQTKSLEEASK